MSPLTLSTFAPHVGKGQVGRQATSESNVALVLNQERRAYMAITIIHLSNVQPRSPPPPPRPLEFFRSQIGTNLASSRLSKPIGTVA